MAEFAPKTILCPVDLSSASAAVLSWARLLAQAFKARVEALHASWSEPPRYFLGDQVRSLAVEEKSEIEKLRRSLQQAARKAMGSKTNFEVLVKPGHAVQVILEHTRRHRPDLIVMGSHGHSGVARLLLGSVAENVVREAGVPVLIVRGAPLPAEQAGLRRVLCPVEVSEESRDCAQIAAGTAKALGAELQLLQAIEDGAADEQARQRLCSWFPQEARRQCSVSEVVRRGNPAEQIILFAREHAVDLIVLGAEPHHFLEFSALGRTSERVMRHAPCSVLLLPGKKPSP
jgi:nucleotide-binding universal stress UspA family protein